MKSGQSEVRLSVRCVLLSLMPWARTSSNRHRSNGSASRSATAGTFLQPPPLPRQFTRLTRLILTAFFDGILPLQLERSDIAGASVLVMKDGNVLLQKGYGYADVKSKKPVDPNSTIFRLASISKLFTWVSVMQLVEQGKLNLDTDVNQYLDFQIRPAFDQARDAAQPDDAYRRI